MAADTRAAEPRVFLSYAHQDNDASREIARAFEDRRLTVWLDRWQVEHGESLAAQILHAVGSQRHARVAAVLGRTVSP